MIAADLLYPSIEAYFDHLDNGGQRMSLPAEPQHESNLQYAWPSALGYCPLRSALRRAEVLEFIPETPDEKRTWRLRAMGGTRYAEIIQEALLFYAPKQIKIEYEFKNSVVGLKGRIDAVYTPDYGENALLEIKTSGYGKPTLGQVMQVLSYVEYGVSSARGYIILCKPFGGNPADVWELRPEGQGYIVVNEWTGEMWKDPANTPETLNRATLERLMQQHHEYLAAVDRERHQIVSPESMHAQYILPPYSLDDDEAWQCFRVLDQPKRYKRAYNHPNGTRYEAGEVRPGSAVPSCAYFCHGFADTQHPVVIDLVQDPETGEDRRVYRFEERTYETGERDTEIW